MKPFVTYLKRQSPPQQLPSFTNGWIELQNGQRWNPSHNYKYNADMPRRSLLSRLLSVFRGIYGN